jgi:hypothetical protein
VSDGVIRFHANSALLVLGAAATGLPFIDKKDNRNGENYGLEFPLA